MSLAISQHISSLQEVEERFNAVSTSEDSFFPEWQHHLLQLSSLEKTHCDQIKARYLYHRHHGSLAEGLINQLIIAPLLEILGFYDPPFIIRSEYPIEIIATDHETIYRGRIDTLVFQERFWLLVIETKSSMFSLEAGIPQLLAYLLANPNQEKATYGLISNGGSSMFAKVQYGIPAKYALSDDFSLYNSESNELYTILSILKQIKQFLMAN